MSKGQRREGDICLVLVLKCLETRICKSRKGNAEKGHIMERRKQGHVMTGRSLREVGEKSFLLSSFPTKD